MRLSTLIFFAPALVLATMRPIDAEDTVSGPLYIVTYFDVAPTAAQQAATRAGEFAAASRKDDANVGFQVFEEIGRPNRLAILEAWRDKKAYEANGEAAGAAAFRDKLQPLLISGTGARFLGGLSGSAPAARPRPRTGDVPTHADVPAPRND